MRKTLCRDNPCAWRFSGGSGRSDDKTVDLKMAALPRLISEVVAGRGFFCDIVFPSFVSLFFFVGSLRVAPHCFRIGVSFYACAIATLHSASENKATRHREDKENVGGKKGGKKKEVGVRVSGGERLGTAKMEMSLFSAISFLGNIIRHVPSWFSDRGSVFISRTSPIAPASHSSPFSLPRLCLTFVP